MNKLIIIGCSVLIVLSICGVVRAEAQTEEHISKGIKITGSSVSLQNQILIDDVVGQLEAFNSGVKLVRIDVSFIRLVKEHKEWLERWIVYDIEDSPKEYTVRFTLTPEIGGTDISIKEGGEYSPPSTQQVIIDMR